MPALQQQRSNYKETSNIQRFNTNYYKRDARKSPAAALAKALNVTSDILLDEKNDADADAAREAKQQEQKSILEGKRLAMLGVQRENLAEASGEGGGPFDENSSWTREGFDIQRGVEDAILKAGEITDAYNSSDLWKTEDPEVFEAFIAQQREQVMGTLGDSVSEQYREGFLSGIAPSFQRVSRKHAGHLADFRTRKKALVFQQRISDEVRTASGKGVKRLVGDAPANLGMPTGEAMEAAVSQLEKDLGEGLYDLDALDMKDFSKENQVRLQTAASKQDTAREYQDMQKDRAHQLEVRRLVGRVTVGDPEALKDLEALDPEAAHKLRSAQTAVNETFGVEHVPMLEEGYRNDDTFGSEDMAHRLTSAVISGELDNETYNRLDQENTDRAALKTLTGRRAYYQTLAHHYSQMRRPVRAEFDAVLSDQLRFFNEANERSPSPQEFKEIARDSQELLDPS